MYKFKHMEITEFNKKYNTNLQYNWLDGGYFYDKLIEVIEQHKNIELYSSSFNHEDVLIDIEEKEDIFNFDLIEIENIYIAIY